MYVQCRDYGVLRRWTVYINSMCKGSGYTYRAVSHGGKSEGKVTREAAVQWKKVSRQWQAG